eukprot:TRINITY_DN1336_c0_g1_i1.p1 TRINITY_DN1336_c0_g1~~TRINITY_DN1336_c0_g1_i1.p1  ORF type:complete len:349 (+),score=56.79 TRINITY_DN1336_c0_g1_i1:74-1120(+)
MNPENEKYTMEQVAADSDLMVWKGWVINVKSFKDDHPGGSKYISNWAGRDISEIFSAESPHRHSSYAEKVLDSLKVGTVIGQELSKKEATKYNGMVDVDAPFLFQVSDLGESYHGWMASQPVVRKLTIFPYPILEALSRYPWWWIWVVIPPIIAFGLFTSINAGIDLISGGLFFTAGLTTWVFMEYLLHRMVFHIVPDSPGWNLFHFFAHGLHHLTPHDPTRLTFPPPFTLALAVLFWNIFKVVCLGHIGFSVLFAGFVTGYVSYDTTHFLYHHTDGSRYGSVVFPKFFSAYLKFMKSHHNTHHFLNEDCNFGVSNPILDFVFGTYMSKAEAEHQRELKAARATAKAQ